MIFEKESLVFNILEVFELKQKNITMFNSGRNFSALSFRYHADTVLKTKNKEYYMRDNFVSYVPARLDYERISNVDELIVIHFDTINYTTRDIEYFIPQDPVRLSKLFYEIFVLWNKRELGYKHKCSSILYEIFAECYVQNFVVKPQNLKIQRSVEYLLSNFKKRDLSIKEISEKSNISEVYFRKLFKEDYGVSPQKYIVDLRIQNAVGLISTGYYSLKEIAYMSGYNDYKYFSIEFKKKMGISPSEYIYDYKCDDVSESDPEETKTSNPII